MDNIDDPQPGPSGISAGPAPAAAAPAAAPSTAGGAPAAGPSTAGPSTAGGAAVSAADRERWRYMEAWFTVADVQKDGQRFIFKCTQCPQTISQHVSSRSSLQKHYERKHAGMAANLKAACLANKALPGPKYKRDREPETGTSAVPSKKPRQLTFAESLQRQGPVSQAQLDKWIVSLISEGMLPLRVVELDAFKVIIQNGYPGKTVPGRTALDNRIRDTYSEMKITLLETLQKVKYVSTTADCWSANKKSYLGMTVHWLEVPSMIRRQALLVCRRLKGSHTHDVLAAAMDTVHCEFAIQDKVTFCTTDNASNFVKAFNIFGQAQDVFDSDTDSETGRERGSESDSESDSESLTDVEADSDSDSDSEISFPRVTREKRQTANFVEIDELPQPEDAAFSLPSHMRCAAHTLNLISTRDIAQVMGQGDKLPKAIKKPKNCSTCKTRATFLLSS